MSRSEPEIALAYLRQHKLRLTTAESCTAGKIIQLLANIPGCGELMDCGYVVYSVAAKKRLLNVQQATIDRYSLTSEEVAREMAYGALLDSTANVAIATTGVAGPDAMDGVPPGTVCFAWGFQRYDQRLFSETHYFQGDHFKGDRAAVCEAAACYALARLPYYHALFALHPPARR